LKKIYFFAFQEEMISKQHSEKLNKFSNFIADITFLCNYHYEH